MIKIIYPGTFDPITKGHYDLICKAIKLFNNLIIAVSDNPQKKTLFTLIERIELVQSSVKHLKQATVVGFDNLLVDCAKKYQAKAILRGLRTASDFNYEVQLTEMNRKLNSDLESVFLTSAQQYNCISSSLVKEIAYLNGDVSHFVSPEIAFALKNKIKIIT